VYGCFCCSGVSVYGCYCCCCSGVNVYDCCCCYCSGVSVWLVLLLLLWGKCVWLLLLKCRLLLTVLAFLSGALSLQATHRSYCIDYKYYSCWRFGCRDTTD
jgi:hypothetical protein